jgi:hypothetical protein
MRKTAYLGRKFYYYFFILMMGLLLNSGNFIDSAAKEPTKPVQQKPVKLQDQTKKKSDEKAISDDDVKIWLKQIEIYGQIAKPQTVFIIPGTDPRVDGLRIDRHFFSHIFRPVEKSTLSRVRIKQEQDKDHILW